MTFLTWLKETFVPAHDPGCFVYRPIVNSQELYTWARAQNITGLQFTSPERLHVTVMHSKKDVRPNPNFSLDPFEVRCPSWDFAPYLGQIGVDGAVALKFNNQRLFKRWTELLGLGAVWSFPSYVPHVTLGYWKPAAANEIQSRQVMDIPSPSFDLILGPEKVEDLDE